MTSVVLPDPEPPGSSCGVGPLTADPENGHQTGTPQGSIVSTARWDVEGNGAHALGPDPEAGPPGGPGACTPATELPGCKSCPSADRSRGPRSVA